MALPHDPLTGSAREVADALADRYTVEKELGRGGMATVYLALDLKHDRHVAIKVLHPDLAASLGAERFLREIKIAARLNHPHILPIHDSGEAGRFLFYVMPFAEGESLRDRLTREKQLPVEDALRIAREVADALSYAHAHDVVHRDIKPENILLDAGHAVVADFGIARAISAAGGDNLTQTGMSVGTPAYMSPEQASASGDVDGRSDLYSLACVLYEMLAGQPPFTGPTLESIVRQHIVEEPPSITRIRPAVPGEVVAALTRALAKAPADRFNPVALFGEALGRHENVAPRSAGAPGRWVPRRAWQLLIAAVAVVAVVLGGLSVFRSGESGASANERTVIAVLPLRNLTTDSAHSFFAGGLHDEILSQLSRIGSLRVISRTSVLGYAGTGTSIREIGAPLGAGSIVEGSVQVIGERLRVIVQLTDASSDAHIWSNTYDRTLVDAFAIQSDVAKQIVAAVGAALTATEQRGLAEAPTSDAEAYQFYLQGREYWQRPGRHLANLRIAQEAFERAIARDPGFALAHASLSLVHGRMYWNGFDRAPSRAETQLREALEAVRLAPELTEAHYALGYAHYWGRRDYAEALKELSIAEKGRPNDAELIAAIAFVHRRLGNWAQVISAYERTARLSPRDADVFFDLGGNTFRRLGRFDDAVQAYARASSVAPDVHNSAISRGITYVRWRGQLDTLRALLDLVPRDAAFGGIGLRDAHRAQLLLWERKADSLLAVVVAADERVFTAQAFFTPTALYRAWAHRIRGDTGAARTAFETARVLLDSAARELPDDWRVTAAHGLALAGLGRREEALRMADKLQQSVVYRDALDGPDVAEERARILAQAGATDAALDAIERLLVEPTPFTVHLLRLDPRWDPIRENARFKQLLTKYARAP